MTLDEIQMSRPCNDAVQSTTHDQSTLRLGAGINVKRIERLPQEVPVALVYNGISHAVMLATPDSLDDFALGFSLSEGILLHPRELYGVTAQEQSKGIALELEVSAERFARLKERRRSLAGRTGCGLCGLESLDAAIQYPPPVKQGLRVSVLAIQRALAEMPLRQDLHCQTHAVHAAAWANCHGEILLLKEDVGRHNALDKLLGAMARQGISLSNGFALMTSRASVEMVQKAATLGAQLMVFISAPTGLAVKLAEQAGVTLIGSARNAELSIYAHPFRIHQP